MVATPAERATSFGSVATDYDRYRPAPPPEAADWLLPDDVSTVADVCAGTGGFSRVLSARGIEVVAVELDPRMATVLRDRSPHVHAAVGRGEELPIRTCSLDAVLVSSAWHWLDPSRAVPEMARVLRPGGVLGVLWNGPNRRVDWVNEILGENHAGVAPSGGPRRRLEIPEGQPFGIPAARVIEWTLPRTRAQLIGLAGTYSRVITLTPGERGNITRRAADRIDQHPQLRNRPSIDLPMSVRAWKAVRRSDRVS